MSRRHLNIAVVFVWALAHGVWMGAGMHSFADIGGRNCAPIKGGAPICAACSSAPSKPIILVSDDGIAAGCCAVCKLSTVLPEISVAQAPLFIAARFDYAAPQAFESADLSFAFYRHPPTHAPPA